MKVGGGVGVEYWRRMWAVNTMVDARWWRNKGAKIT
jgi:hypothetical protein